MKVKALVLTLAISGCCCSHPAVAQDFIIQGCYWDCAGNENEEADPKTVAYWSKKIKGQAPELSHAGFTYYWLPIRNPNLTREISQLTSVLQGSGLKTLADLHFPADSSNSPALFLQSPLEQATILWDQYSVRGFRLNYNARWPARDVAFLVNQFHSRNRVPSLLISEFPEWEDPMRLSAWINAISEQLTQGAASDTDVRTYDLVLREALRRACDEQGFDVRQIYSQSLRDATPLSGFKIVTVVNGPEFENPGMNGNGLIRYPLLAYAYILTNNQIGLPSVYYADYYGREAEVEPHLQKAPLQEAIDQLIDVHQRFIFNSTALEYLNHPESNYSSHYLSAAEGADASTTIIFQMDGTNTPAGKTNRSGSGKDVIAAINFSKATLRLVQEINMANVNLGEVFTDIMGKSNHSRARVLTNDTYQVPNSVYIELPPRSYSVWVQGAEHRLLESKIDFFVDASDRVVELNWEVPLEKEIAGYEVHRSINRKAFQKIAFLKAIGAPDGGSAYLHLDEDVFPNESLYYRIKILFPNGRFEYSPVRSIKMQEKGRSFEWVNAPGNDKGEIRIRCPMEGKGRLSVFNSEGKRVLYLEPFLKKGLNETDIDLSKLPKGVYLLELVTSDNKHYSERIIRF